MTRRPTDREAALRWYPRAWRQRYGQELMALMEDQGDRERLTGKARLSLAGAGLRERLHASKLIGDQGSPRERARAGSLLVLCAWAAFVVAGASFSKSSEHFARALPVGARSIPQAAFDVVAGLGVLGAALVALGVVLALPGFLRFLGGGGWPSIRGHVLRAGLFSALTVGTVFPLAIWAHHLNPFERNGGNGLYSAAFVAWALLVAGTLALWTVAGVAAARRIDFSPRVLRWEAGLAIAVAGTMVVMTAATAVWWEVMAQRAPWFLATTAAKGTSPAPFNAQLVLTMALMLGAVVVSAYGVIRLTRTWTGLRTA